MSENEQTNEKREMMADIVTELRKESKKVRTVTRPDGYGGYEEITLEGNPYFKNLADRIDAAWKRERAKVDADALEVGGIIEAARTAEKSSAVGNTAAMREALVNLDKWLFIGVDGYVHGQPDMTDEIERTIKSALSAPARNCDLNLSEKSLWDKFEDYMNDCGLPFYSEPSGEDAFEWLLAPATKKGENDGIK